VAIAWTARRSLTVAAPAKKRGFTFVDTELVLNGPDPGTTFADGLFQRDGLHPTAAEAFATAKVFAEADGLGG